MREYDWDSYNFGRRGMDRTQRMQFQNRRNDHSRDAGQVSGALGMSTLPDVNRTVQENSPDWGKIGQERIINESKLRQAAHEAGAAVRAKKIWAEGQIEAAEIIGKAHADAANKAASGNMLGGALSGAFSIGAALISDETTKNTIEGIEDALTTLRNLRPVSFYYNEEYSCNPERQHYGFIAQEYAKVMPDATYFDDELGKMAIDTGELIGLLVRAVQQLETKVIRLEAAKALVGVKQ